MAMAALAALSLLASPGRVDAQINRLRRARERVTSSLPSLGSLFGEEPPITTTLEDAKDGVPALDGFEPEAFSPMVEMPRGPGGYYLLAPGAYTMEVESFCVWPGTYEPREGNGYVYAELKGPKAALVSAIIGRSADAPDIDRRAVQELLWAVLSRAKPSEMHHDMQLTAARLLTPEELAEMEGYALDAVPDAIGKRVLQDVPAPVRAVLEAQNDMRRLFASPDTRFEDLERVAVLTGALPPGEAGDPLPAGRWAFHPNGYFIRVIPHTRSYYTTRLQVYYPVSVEIERDPEGRITSVTTPDGRWVGADYGEEDASSFARNDPDAREGRLRAIRFASGPDGAGSPPRLWPVRPGVRVPAPRWAAASRGAGGPGLAGPLDLARADLQDLALLGGIVGRELGDRSDAAARAAEGMMRSAVHAALARYYVVLSRRFDDASGASRLVPRLVRTAAGYRYAIAAGVESDAPSRFQHPGRMMPIQPGSGAAFPASPLLQRLAISPRPDKPDALDMARDFTGALSNANNGLGLATDPGGFFGGLLPGLMFGAGMDWDFKNARDISDAMQGATGGHDDAMLGPWVPEPEVGPTWPVAEPSTRTASLVLASPPAVRPLLALRTPQDYHTVLRPRTIELPTTPTSAEISPEHAAAVDAVLRQTFRLGALLEAALTAHERHARAAVAQDGEWEYTQAQALVFLKREAGLAMVSLAEDLETLRATAGDAHGLAVSEASVRAAQIRLGAGGIPAGAAAVAQAVGLGDEWARTRGARLGKLSPAEVADGAASSLQNLVDELRSYGAYWASLPVVPQPWTDDEVGR
jgi:hypothetical protein